jgi:hypothetical protein
MNQHRHKREQTLYPRGDIVVYTAVRAGEYMNIFAKINDVSRENGKREK